MADSVSDNLTATVRTVMIWNRVNELEVGQVASSKTLLHTYPIADGIEAGEADLIFADTRTIPANTVDTLDLSNLEQTSFGVAVPFDFKAIRFFRVRNLATTSGQRILVGASAGAPTSVYAADVGPGADWFAMNYNDAWQVTADNKEFRISNPNAAAVTYELYIIGTDQEPA